MDDLRVPAVQVRQPLRHLDGPSQRICICIDDLQAYEGDCKGLMTSCWPENGDIRRLWSVDALPNMIASMNDKFYSAGRMLINLQRKGQLLLPG